MAEQDLPYSLDLHDKMLGEGGQQVPVSAVDLEGGERNSVLRRICRIGSVSVGSVAVGCEDLPIGVASDEADALSERRQAFQHLGGHWTSDHVPANHYEIRIDALEVC